MSTQVGRIARRVKRHECDVCRKWGGIEVKYVDGWAKRGASLYAVRGFGAHHTASSPLGGPRPALGTCIFGRPDLPGPLCNFHLGRDARITVVAAGRANHLGLGGPWGDIPANAGNGYVVGTEAENNGIGEHWSPKMLHAYKVLAAATLEEAEERTYYAFGHKEWTSRKIDPNGIAMGQFRRQVKRLRKGHL